MRLTMRVAAIAFSVGIGLVAVSAYAPARTDARFAGVVRGTYAQHLALELPDRPGHFMALWETRGTHESSGEAAFLPNGQVRTVELITTDEGKGGTDRGFMSVALGPDTVAVTYDGTTRPDSARMRIVGKMQFVRGTGRFAGITGTASYEGFAAQAGYELRWEGTYRLAQ